MFENKDNCTPCGDDKPKTNEVVHAPKVVYVPVPGKDGHTPVKGVDYFDGKDGKTPKKGVDYFDGKDAEPKEPIAPAKIQPVYKLTKTDVQPAIPTANFLAEGWGLKIQSTDEVNKFQWVSQRYVGGNLPEDFSEPALYSNFAMPGLDGKDGKDIEFIFRLSDKLIQFDTPVDATNTDDYIPEGWEDNADGPNLETPYEYFTKRAKIRDTWMPYDTPSLWSVFAANGEDGKDGKDFEFIFKLTEENVQPDGPIGDPRVDESFPADWTDDPISVNSIQRYQWFSKRAKVKDTGLWGEYSGPALWTVFSVDGRDGKDGKDIEWTFKLTTEEVVPNTPVAPDDITDDWFDEANDWTDDSQSVSKDFPFEYTSHRRRLASGKWGPFSTPGLWSRYGKDGVDGDTYEYIFKRTKANIRPARPLEVSQIKDFVPEGWTDDAMDITPEWGFQWQSKREREDGFWGEFSEPKLVHRIGEKGDNGLDGKYSELRFAKNGSSVSPPDLNATADYPEGWTKSKPSLLFNEYLWMISGDKNPDGTLIDAWDEPTRINGANGVDGEDGPGIEFIFMRKTSNQKPPIPDSVNEDDSIPLGWFDNQQGVSSSYPFEFSTHRKKIDGVWGKFQQPVLWAVFSRDGNDGDDGIDGKGVEFIFKQQAVPNIPSTPVGTQKDDNVPNGWTDDMQGVSSTNPYEFVSKRTKVGGVWSAFSVPKLWSKMGEKGDSVQGPALVYKGVYRNDAIYVGNINHIDIVKYNDGVSTKFFMTRTDAGNIPAGTFPTAVSKWNPFVGQYENIATGLLFAERAVVENLVVTEILATKGTIGKFTIQGTKLECKVGGTRFTIETDPGNPYLEIVGAKTTRIDFQGIKTDYGVFKHIVVGEASGNGGLFIDCDNVFYRGGNNTEGLPWYGGRTGEYGSDGFSLLSRTAEGVKATVALLKANKVDATYVHSVNGVTTGSDDRIKKDIKASEYGLSAVLKLRPITFKYNKKAGINDEKTHIGLSAQTTQKIIPELVDEANEFLSLNLTEVVPVLIKAIQELHVEVEELRRHNGR